MSTTGLVMDIKRQANLIAEISKYEKIGPPEDDRLYRTVLALRQPGALERKFGKLWRHSLAEATGQVDVQVCATHYKPFSRASLVVEVVIPLKASSEPQVKQFLLIIAHATSKEARRTLAAASSKPPLDAYAPPVFFITKWKSVVWALPNGPKLQSARICLDPKIFSEFLTEHGLGLSSLDPIPQPPQLMRYVPGRRTLFRYEEAHVSEKPVLYIKVYRPGLDQVAAKTLNTLACWARRGTFSFQFPRILVHDQLEHILVMDEVPGSQLSSLIATAGLEVFAAVGHALASLHLSEIRPIASWSPAKEVTALRKAMAEVELALPAFSPLIQVLLQVIERRKEEFSWNEGAPIHGNLHGDQILVDGSTNVGIVDWDDLCEGDPLYDIGRLIAHLIFVSTREKTDSSRVARCLESLLDSYILATNQELDRNRLRWHIAVALLLRGKISALRPLPPNWIEDIGESLIGAHKILHGHSQWIAID